MADNVGITPGSGAKAAAREVTYSGETAQVQIVGLATLSGSDDAKTVADVSLDNPLPVRLDGGPSAALEVNNSLQVDATQSNEHSAEALNAPNAALVGDEPVQMVGLHPSYPIPIDTATPMPVAGRDDTGAQRQLMTDQAGAILQSTDVKLVVAQAVIPTSVTGFIYGYVDCAGYQSIVAFCRTPTASLNDTLQFSMDQANWFTARVIDMTNGGQQRTSAGLGTTSDTYHIPVVARYLRFTITLNAAATQYRRWDLYLQRAPLTYPTFPLNASVNLGQINGSAVAATGAQLGVNAFGPSAVAAAHGANNPVQMSGSDGTNVRRILTDTAGNTRVVGPVAAGTSMVSPTNAAFAPNLLGLTDLEGRVQRVTGDVRGRMAATLPDATAADDGIVDALNNVVRELKLLNAKITDLPIYLGLGAAMPDDDKAFRDDPTIFNS